MSLLYFEGPAGTGKTTRLIQNLNATLQIHPLVEGQRILALTKMHGSRRRIHHRLSSLPELRAKFECVTVDSFAWRILRRWRTVAKKRFGEQGGSNDYAEVCKRAGLLLADPLIARWTTRAFPILIVDELQDSKDGQLDIIRALASTTIALAAADEFQDLDGSSQNAAVTWARQFGQIVPLTKVHRTNVSGLLEAAQALRVGRPIPENGNGFNVVGAHNENVGASYVSRSLTWWNTSNDIAIITPVRAENAPFVHDLICRVERGPIGKPPVGPHFVPWENSQDDEMSQFFLRLALPMNCTAEVDVAKLTLPDDMALSAPLADWFHRHRSLTARTKFTVAEIQEQARTIHQRSRAHRRNRERGVRVMTIHQAKNREFDSVIVLWPYQVGNDQDRCRRLLYNAITRAKHRVLVVVQNPSRLNKPPFMRLSQ